MSTAFLGNIHKEKSHYLKPDAFKDNKDYMSYDTSSVNYDYTIAQKKRRQQRRQQGYELSQKIMQDPTDNQDRYLEGIYY